MADLRKAGIMTRLLRRECMKLAYSLAGILAALLLAKAKWRAGETNFAWRQSVSALMKSRIDIWLQLAAIIRKAEILNYYRFLRKRAPGAPNRGEKACEANRIVLP